MNAPHPVWKKLQYKSHSDLNIQNAPAQFAPVVHALPPVAARSLAAPFLLHFCITQAQLQAAAQAAAALPEGDVMVWVAYPKKSSKHFSCEFDRDHGWDVFGEAGFEGVRMVAIDADRSALRLRRVAYIKSLKRSSTRALSAEGKRRTSDNSSRF